MESILTDADKEVVRQMTYAGSYSREKADRYVNTVEAIVARYCAKAEQRGAERALREAANTPWEPWHAAGHQWLIDRADLIARNQL